MVRSFDLPSVCLITGERKPAIGLGLTALGVLVMAMVFGLALTAP